MTATTNPNYVAWIPRQPRSPLCDVPWVGTVVVLSDGSVNFCCYSSAVVGNVNRESFEDIWDGPIMRDIRQALSEHRLPPQCQSTSCPFYRGDELSYIYDRMEGSHSFRATGTPDPHAQVRGRLRGSELRVSRNELRTGDSLEVSLEFFYQGKPMLVDLFVGIRCPDGVIRFLPDFEDYPEPFLSFFEFGEDRSPLQFTVLDHEADCFQAAGEYEICAALFEGGSNPNILSNCYWSESKTIIFNSMPADLG
jgi:hypothetical protein